VTSSVRTAQTALFVMSARRNRWATAEVTMGTGWPQLSADVPETTVESTGPMTCGSRPSLSDYARRPGAPRSRKHTKGDLFREDSRKQRAEVLREGRPNGPAVAAGDAAQRDDDRGQGLGTSGHRAVDFDSAGVQYTWARLHSCAWSDPSCPGRRVGLSASWRVACGIGANPLSWWCAGPSGSSTWVYVPGEGQPVAVHLAGFGW